MSFVVVATYVTWVKQYFREKNHDTTSEILKDLKCSLQTLSLCGMVLVHNFKFLHLMRRPFKVFCNVFH